MAHRRRCYSCRNLVESGVIRVYGGPSWAPEALDYRPGHQPRGLPSQFLCDSCKAPVELDDTTKRALAEWGDQSA